MLARSDRGRKALYDLDLPYPGGDSCPSRVVIGLAKLRRMLDMAKCSFDADEERALAWIAMWVEAGAAMLPEDMQ